VAKSATSYALVNNKAFFDEANLRYAFRTRSGVHEPNDLVPRVRQFALIRPCCRKRNSFYECSANPWELLGEIKPNTNRNAHPTRR
ncbi:MAG TPA: hypothetical protein VL243_00340, partial [Vicinamibacterales bacterium]|nr:hypothetical protein [Vicinamibacterales bacterium]